MKGKKISSHPIHLGRGATAVAEPLFTGGLKWYQAYEERHVADGNEGRLVSMFTFDKPWDSREMHPNGCEVVLCIAGRIMLHPERADGSRNITTLEPGQCTINEPGTWHTADVESRASAVFISAGLGTTLRPRAIA
jgi:quercetin dioxygenase-like cupin family protein